MLVKVNQYTSPAATTTRTSTAQTGNANANVHLNGNALTWGASRRGRDYRGAIGTAMAGTPVMDQPIV